MKEMQELIEAAEAYLNWHEDRPYVGYFNEISGRFKYAIAAARASEGGWIDCKEELPTNEVMVLTFAKHPVLEGFETARYTRSGFWTNSHLIPTHWQPLPSPPLSVENPEVQK